MDGAEQATPRPEDARPRSGQTGALPVQPTQPVAVDTQRIVAAGLVCWVVALVVVLAVPSLHEGARSWWPWVCVAGLVLGALGFVYVHRGRGNAAGARRG
jgi:hypothetical protein